MNSLEIKDRLIDLGITVTEVARSSGRSLGHVSMSLNGQRPMSKHLTAVAMNLIEKSELAGNDDEDSRGRTYENG